VGCLRLVLAHGEVGHVPPAELRRFIREALARFPCRFVRVVAVRVAPTALIRVPCLARVCAHRFGRRLRRRP
jgi:hypothetical protein